MLHVMLDLETWGTRPGSALRSIGAVTFDDRTRIGMKDIGPSFYRNIDKGSCDVAGLTVDPETVAWWEKQSPESHAALAVDPRSLPEVVDEFHSWFRQMSARFIWSHGGNFDEPLWQASCRTVGKTAPWKFWDARCTRTIYGAAGIDLRSFPREGVHHNALDDAIHQARCVQHAMAKLRVAA